MAKTARQLERYFKGVANHRRLDILMLINKEEGITLEGISETLKCNIKTISGHTQKLVQAGLVNKRYKGKQVVHSLSPYGKEFIKFIEKFK
jgi:DNA-binding MarR family transcriptional regulator